MTAKQKIAKLEAEVAELQMKVRLLEARPMVIAVSPNVSPWQPAPFTQPYPYIGDPTYPVTSGSLTVGTGVQPLTVGAQSGHNMSSQQSDLMQ